MNVSLTKGYSYVVLQTTTGSQKVLQANLKFLAVHWNQLIREKICDKGLIIGKYEFSK